MYWKYVNVFIKQFIVAGDVNPCTEELETNVHSTNTRQDVVQRQEGESRTENDRRGI